MSDLDVSMTTVLATVLWVAGAVLGVVAIATRFDTGALGMITAGGGAILNIRGFFVKLERCEFNAFELGRDYETTRVHSVP